MVEHSFEAAFSASVRGYTKLLADDLDDVERDFHAVCGTSDDKLWAQVWFNRGLVHEKRANEAPTKAAAAKLEGKILCPVGVGRSAGKVYPSWMASASLRRTVVVQSRRWIAKYESLRRTEVRTRRTRGTIDPYLLSNAWTSCSRSSRDTGRTKVKLQTDLREFVALLTSSGVEFLVVGGHALAFHGHPRFTGDIDLLVSPST